MKSIILIVLVVSALGHLYRMVAALQEAAQHMRAVDATPTSAADSESNNGVRH